MVRLMMRAAYQYADETEAANMLDFLRIRRGDGEKLAIRQRRRLGIPAVKAVHGLSVGRDHPLDGDECAPTAGDRDLQAAVDLFRGSVGLQRDLVHVDEMLTQRFKIYFGPIRLWVGVEHAHDLLNRSESTLARQGWR